MVTALEPHKNLVLENPAAVFLSITFLSVPNPIEILGVLAMASVGVPGVYFEIVLCTVVNAVIIQVIFWICTNFLIDAFLLLVRVRFTSVTGFAVFTSL
mgnify:CR=1 FL=1